MAQVQIPFISAPFKKTADVDWIFPLKHYIAHVYQEDPEKYNEETFTLNRLRQDTRGAGKDITGRDLLYRYFGQLELLDLRFPVDEKHVKVLFTWYDAFDGRATAQYSLAYEKASVIFNIAATLSAIAAGQNRAEAEGRKMAFNFFQAAAGMFQYINDNFLHAPSQDLSRETVKMLTELMLAQAHECFLESSLREKKKDGLIAKLGSHAAWAYENLVYELQDSIGRGVGIDKAWVTVCQVKQKYYQALAQEHRAALCEAEQQYGEQVARLKAAESFGKEATKLCSSLNSQLQSSNYANGTLPPDSGSALQELVRAKAASCSEKHAAATRDNDMIYHEAVPQESILTPIDRLKAVKPTQISDLYGQNEIGKVIGADIFARLVPLSVHESASMYSEEKAKLLRGESERCDMAKAELNTALEYMKLPGSLDKFRQQEDRSIDELMVPTKDAREWADQIALEESASRTSLRELIDTLDGFKRDATKKLDESSMSLDQEMRECENMRVKFGQDWSQQPSGHLTGDFRHDIKSHRDALQQAAQSDMELLRRLDVISADINILKKGGNSSDLEKAFAEGVAQVFKQGNQKGDMANSLLDLDLGGDAAKKADMQNKVKQIEATLEKLRKIEVERKETLQDLREKTMQDDISNVLILNKKAANVEQQIFAAEIEKYRPHQQRISATIAQQQQTLQELTALFKALMENQEATKLQSRYDEAEQQRQKVIGRLARAKHEYFDVKEGLNKGVEFYSNLLDTIESLARNIQNFVQERAQERNRLAEELGSKQSIKEQEMLRQKISSYSMATPSAPSIPPAQTSSPQSIVPDPMSRLTEQARDMSIHDQQHQQTPHSSYAPISAATPQRSMSTHSEQYSMGMPSPATAPAAPPAASAPVSQPYRPSGPSYKAQPTTPQTTMYQTQPYVNAPPYSPVQTQLAYNTSYQPCPAPPPVPPSPGYHQQQPQQQQPPSLPPKPNHPPPQRAPSMPSYPPTSPPPVGAPYGAMPQAQSQSTYSNPNLGYISAPQPLASQQPPAGGYYHHPPPPPQTSQQSYYGGQYPPAPPSSHHQPPPPPGGAPAPGYPPYPYQNTVAHPGPTPGHTWQQQPQQPGYQPPAPHGEPSWNQSNNSSLLD